MIKKENLGMVVTEVNLYEYRGKVVISKENGKVVDYIYCQFLPDLPKWDGKALYDRAKEVFASYYQVRKPLQWIKLVGNYYPQTHHNIYVIERFGKICGEEEDLLLLLYDHSTDMSERAWIRPDGTIAQFVNYRCGTEKDRYTYYKSGAIKAYFSPNCYTRWDEDGNMVYYDDGVDVETNEVR